MTSWRGLEEKIMSGGNVCTYWTYNTFLNERSVHFLDLGSSILPVSTSVGRPDLSVPFQKAIPEAVYRRGLKGEEKQEEKRLRSFLQKYSEIYISLFRLHNTYF